MTGFVERMYGEKRHSKDKQIWYFIIILFYFTWVFMCTSFYASLMCGCWPRPTKGDRSPGTIVTGNCEAPDGGWEPNLGFLQVWQVLLTPVF